MTRGENRAAPGACGSILRGSRPVEASWNDGGAQKLPSKAAPAIARAQRLAPARDMACDNFRMRDGCGSWGCAPLRRRKRPAPAIKTGCNRDGHDDQHSSRRGDGGQGGMRRGNQRHAKRGGGFFPGYDDQQDWMLHDATIGALFCRRISPL